MHHCSAKIEKYSPTLTLFLTLQGSMFMTVWSGGMRYFHSEDWRVILEEINMMNMEGSVTNWIKVSNVGEIVQTHGISCRYGTTHMALV